MGAYPVSRDAIVNAIRDAVEPSSYVDAMWEGGAVAFNRVDQWSDIDLYLAVQDDRVQDAVASAESAVSKLATIATRYILLQPTWHRHWQGFYQLEGASPFLILDFVVMKRSATNKFLEPEIHGQPLVYFDKTGFTKVAPIDDQAFNAKLKERLETLRVTFPLFQTLILKEINRRNSVEALAFYQGFTLRPLVEVLRIKHSPHHHDFYSRYLYHDLPTEMSHRLERLFYVVNPEELSAKHKEAEEWFLDTLGSL